jgi:hypothetical protein
MRFIPARGRPGEPAVRSYRLFNTALDFIFSGLKLYLEIEEITPHQGSS